MRYRPVASPAFVARWFADGAGRAALAAAPVVVFDRKDDPAAPLPAAAVPGAAWIRRPHHVPASAAVRRRRSRLGFGWGLVPRLQSRRVLDAGTLVELDRRGGVDVDLYWQQWSCARRRSDRVAEAVRAGAAAVLD